MLREDWAGGGLAGVVFALAFFTKQSVVFFLLPAALYYFVTNRRFSLYFSAIFGFLSLAGMLFMNELSSGWYYYIVTLPGGQIIDTSWTSVWGHTQDILLPVSLPLLIAFLPVLFTPQVTRLFERVRSKAASHHEVGKEGKEGKAIHRFLFPDSLAAIVKTWIKSPISSEPGFRPKAAYPFFIFLVIVNFAGALYGTLYKGGAHNAFIAFYALLAILFGAGFQRLQESLELNGSAIIRPVCSALLVLTCLTYFYFAQYSPKEYIPNSQDLERGNTLVKYLEETDDNVLLPTQNYLALYTHKKMYFNEVTFEELGSVYLKQPTPE